MGVGQLNLYRMQSSNKHFSVPLALIGAAWVGPGCQI